MQWLFLAGVLRRAHTRPWPIYIFIKQLIDPFKLELFQSVYTFLTHLSSGSHGMHVRILPLPGIHLELHMSVLKSSTFDVIFMKCAAENLYIQLYVITQNMIMY